MRDLIFKKGFFFVFLAVCVILLGSCASAAPAVRVESVPPSTFLSASGDIEIDAENDEEIILMDNEEGWGYLPPLDNRNPSNSSQQTEEMDPRDIERRLIEEQIARQWTDVKEDLDMREIDKRARELVKEYSAAKHGVPPAMGSNGALVITYSSYTPKIKCRPLRVTDIILQPGEKVTSLHAGDTVRWTFQPGVSGAGEYTTVHVMIKPLMPDISTNLVIHTDRRTYNLDLFSGATEYWPSVSFGYPDDELLQWKAFLQKKQQENANTIYEGHATDPLDIYLDYEIRGNQTWKPLRVWDDGVKTYIQMPKNFSRSSEAPVVLAYTGKTTRIINYRLHGNLYVLDGIYKKVALVAGTGKSQERIAILRTPLTR